MAGGLGLALHQRGVHVTGTDDRQFSPMPELVMAAGIPLAGAWDAANIPAGTEVVVAGGQVGPDNPEWQAAVARGLPVLNAAAFLEKFVLRTTRNTVVAGTKGKSTTSAMLAWILNKAAAPADHLIGGQVRGGNWPLLSLLGRPDFILEGDEYPCGPDDPLPKFARYRAKHLLITSISHDHPEVYAKFEDYENAFVQAIRALPVNGSLIINADDAGALRLAPNAPCRVLEVGFRGNGEYLLGGFEATPGGSRFLFRDLEITLAVPGIMNARNAALAILAAGQLGIPLENAGLALRDFPGLVGRLEPFCHFGESIFYTEDTAHPMAVRAAMETLRQQHSERRVLAIVFPYNTGGSHGPAQRDLPGSLAAADGVLCLPVIENPVPPGGAFDCARFQNDLRAQGLEVLVANTLPEMISQAVAWCQAGDIIVGFKNVGPRIPWDRLAAALLAPGLVKGASGA